MSQRPYLVSNSDRQSVVADHGALLDNERNKLRSTDLNDAPTASLTVSVVPTTQTVSGNNSIPRNEVVLEEVSVIDLDDWIFEESRPDNMSDECQPTVKTNVDCIKSRDDDHVESKASTSSPIDDNDNHTLTSEQQEVDYKDQMRSRKQPPSIDPNIFLQQPQQRQVVTSDHKDGRILPVVEDRQGIQDNIPRVEYVHNTNGSNYEHPNVASHSNRYNNVNNNHYDHNWGVNSIPIAAEVVMDNTIITERKEANISINDGTNSPVIPFVPVVPSAPLAYAVPLPLPPPETTSATESQPSMSISHSKSSLLLSSSSSSSSSRKYLLIGFIIFIVIGAAIAALFVTGIVQIGSPDQNNSSNSNNNTNNTNNTNNPVTPTGSPLYAAPVAISPIILTTSPTSSLSQPPTPRIRVPIAPVTIPSAPSPSSVIDTTGPILPPSISRPISSTTRPVSLTAPPVSTTYRPTISPETSIPTISMTGNFTTIDPITFKPTNVSTTLVPTPTPTTPSPTTPSPTPRQQQLEPTQQPSKTTTTIGLLMLSSPSN
jgi:hypothetical protein